MNSEAVQSLDRDLRAKLDRVAEVVRRAGRVIVAFSAGVDSTLVLKVALETLGAGECACGDGGERVAGAAGTGIGSGTGEADGCAS